MSPANKGRTFRPGNGKDLPPPPTLAMTIARALREEFGEGRSAIKTIATLTSSNERAVKNWYAGMNGPSGESLISLCRCSDSVLEAVLLLAGRGELVKVKKFSDAKAKLSEMLAMLGDLEQLDQ